MLHTPCSILLVIHLWAHYTVPQPHGGRQAAPPQRRAAIGVPRPLRRKPPVGEDETLLGRRRRRRLLLPMSDERSADEKSKMFKTIFCSQFVLRIRTLEYAVMAECSVLFLMPDDFPVMRPNVPRSRAAARSRAHTCRSIFPCVAARADTPNQRRSHSAGGCVWGTREWSQIAIRHMTSSGHRWQYKR